MSEEAVNLRRLLRRGSEFGGAVDLVVKSTVSPTVIVTSSFRRPDGELVTSSKLRMSERLREKRLDFWSASGDGRGAGGRTVDRRVYVPFR